MIGITSACLMFYVLYKLNAPWFIYIPLVASIMFEVIMVAVKVGEENAKDL